MIRRLGYGLKILILSTAVTMMIFGLFGCFGKGKDLGEGGSCGADMTWTYDRKKQTLTITGTGEMVTENRFMWSDYPIKTLVLSEGITSIAAEAFYSNHDLKAELKLPSTLREIGEFAFYGCEQMTGDLVLPDSVEKVGAYAFERCEGMKSITLSASLEETGRFPTWAAPRAGCGSRTDSHRSEKVRFTNARSFPATSSCRTRSRSSACTPLPGAGLTARCACPRD